MDEKNLKPKSIRITEATAEKFKAIAAELGGNQQQALAKLIDVYELSAGKAVMPARGEDISKFEGLLSAITHMYMGALEDEHTSADRVRAEFEGLLRSKDATIQDLQARIARDEQLRADNERLNDYIDSLQGEADALQTMIADKDELNRALSATCEDLRRKIAGEAEAREALIDVTAERDELRRALAEAELEMERAVLAERQRAQEQINSYQQQCYQILHSYGDNH